MHVDFRYFLLGAGFFPCAGVAAPDPPEGTAYGFFTSKYVIEMRVSFPDRYEGKRLSVYRSSDPGKEVCLPASPGASGCLESFVGAAAVVEFTASRILGDGPAKGSIREVVTVVDQSPGLPDRPPYSMNAKLVNGIASDVQAFGYDESPLPAAARAAEREAAKAVWRRYRQELYLEKDKQPFAVVEWLHTTTRIRILKVESPPSLRQRAPR